jgi:hypothetical protein
MVITDNASKNGLEEQVLYSSSTSSSTSSSAAFTD